MSAGRTGLGEVAGWLEFHGHEKEKDSRVKKLICFISASSEGEREEGITRLKKATVASERRTRPAQTGESGDGVFPFGIRGFWSEILACFST